MGKRQDKSRIDVTAPPSGGLQSDAFAALNSLALPPQGPEPAAANPAQAQVDPPAARGRVVLRRETAQRGGKTVVVVSGFDPAISQEAIETWGRAARKACGCGGTVRGREIEIQGDQPAQVAAFFQAEGFRVAGVVA